MTIVNPADRWCKLNFGLLPGDWIHFLRPLGVWAFQNVLYFLIFIEIFENSTSFSISIRLFIALKRWNFPDNLDFKGKIAAAFLIRSHFISI